MELRVEIKWRSDEVLPVELNGTATLNGPRIAIALTAGAVRSPTSGEIQDMMDAQGTLREAERSAAASAAKAEQDRIGLEAARRADADAFRRYQAEKPVKPPELTVAERTRLLSAQAESAEGANATVLADVE